MELPSVRISVLRIDVVRPVPVIESDETDGVDEKARTEAVRPFQIEEIRMMEIGEDVSALREAQEINRDGIHRYRQAQLEGMLVEYAAADFVLVAVQRPHL